MQINVLVFRLFTQYSIILNSSLELVSKSLCHKAIQNPKITIQFYDLINCSPGPDKSLKDAFEASCASHRTKKRKQLSSLKGGRNQLKWLNKSGRITEPRLRSLRDKLAAQLRELELGESNVKMLRTLVTMQDKRAARSLRDTHIQSSPIQTTLGLERS